MREKNRLRKSYEKKIWEFIEDKDSVQKRRTELIGNLSSLRFWKRDPLTAGYQSLGGEPCLESFYQKRRPGACVFPVLNKNREMDFYFPEDSPSAWRRGAFSIPEPNPEICRKALPGDIRVFLVPGRVFDREGGRLGRGLACYDRYLAQVKGACRVGVAWSFQIHDRPLPVSDHDIPMDFIVTESFVLIPRLSRIEETGLNVEESRNG